MVTPSHRPFTTAFDKAFGNFPYRPPYETKEAFVGPAVLGTRPYGDMGEHVEPSKYPGTGRTYGDFHPTDARAVEIFLRPNHLNLIPNPACRHDANGWVCTSAMSLEPDGWTGQSLHIDGAGKVFYQDATYGLVYVGPTDNGFMPTGRILGGDWWEPQKAGPEYTFSVYAKGSNAYVQLSMYGYKPKDIEGGDISPETTASAQEHSPQYRVDDDYRRFILQTTSRMGNREFEGCWWIRVEVTISADLEWAPNDPEVWLSAFMLDNRETPVAEYFDSELDEDQTHDDFILIRQVNEAPNQAEWTERFIRDFSRRTPRPHFSAYYYDRLARIRWMWRNLYSVVPVNRPIHIYLHDRANPWDPQADPSTSLTALFRRGDFNRGLVHHNTVA